MKWIVFIACIVVMSCTAKKTTGVNNNDANVPACIQKMIRQFEQEDKQNPPRAVYSYTYKGKMVFYVPPVCCDRYSDMYDSNCNLIGHPDGGFTGIGDGTITDFGKTRTHEKLIWKDKRK